MSEKFAIEVSGVSKVYRRFGRRRQFATLKSALVSGTLLRDLRPEETFRAVDDVSFAVPRGSTFGIVGRNGSGKSTMLKLVAGITKPTTGSLVVDGRISALIELGAGFHPEISGRENVFINGVMLGLTRRDIAARFDEIVEFAELAEFIDAPVKNYSSGMYMRLGFAVAVHVDPDVLLVDEVLAVGDESFTHKCLDKFADFRRRGKTILLVTHSLQLVERFCDEAVWLDAGRVKGQGEPRRVVAAYVTEVEKVEERNLAQADAKAREQADRAAAPVETAPEAGAVEGTTRTAAPQAAEGAGAPPAPTAEAPADTYKAGAGRWGSREIEITGVDLVGEDGQAGHVFHAGERVTVRMRFRAARPIADFVFGVGIFDGNGVCCYGTNTDIEEYVPQRVSGEGRVEFVIESLDLVDGTYKVDVAAHKLDGYAYDYHRLLYSFRVKSRSRDVGIYRPKHAWRFSPEVRFQPGTVPFEVRRAIASGASDEDAAGRPTLPPPDSE